MNNVINLQTNSAYIKTKQQACRCFLLCVCVCVCVINHILRNFHEEIYRLL